MLFIMTSLTADYADYADHANYAYPTDIRAVCTGVHREVSLALLARQLCLWRPVRRKAMQLSLRGTREEADTMTWRDCNNLLKDKWVDELQPTKLLEKNLDKMPSP